LDSVVGISIAHPLWDTPDGWVFADRAGMTLFVCMKAIGRRGPNHTGKVTVPILWDRPTRQIVNIESLEIAEMLNDAFDGIADGSSLNPSKMTQAV
jgi:putative glutathione S-transferase